MKRQKPKPAAFMSYVHSDDKYGHLTQFHERLSDEVHIQTGKEFPIFQDRKDILWGQNWKKRIDESIDEVTFLIPIITPSFFNSSACRDELQRFLEREKELGRNDLVLPVYYVDCPLLNDAEKWAGDEIAQEILKHQYADWRELRHEPFTDPQVSKTLEKLAVQIRDVLKRVQASEKPEIPKSAASVARRPVEDISVPLPQDLEYAIESHEPARVPAAKTAPPTRVVDQMHSGDNVSLWHNISILTGCMDMRLNDAREVIGYILSKEFGKIFVEIIILGIHVWAIYLEHLISMYLKVILTITFLIILIDLFKTANTFRKVFQEKHIPIVVAVGRSDDKAIGDDEVRAAVNDVLDSMNEYNFDEKTFEDDFFVNRDNWLVERKSSLPDDSSEWTNIVHRFRDKIIRLSAMPSLRGKKVFHLFLMCPPALAMGMGAVIGTNYEVVLHHLQRGTGSTYPYLPLIDFHSRSDLSQGGIHDIKSKVDSPYEYISVEAPETLTDVVLVSLHLSTHDPRSNVDKLASGRSLSAVHIRNTYNNTLPVDADWFRVANEVADVLLGLSSRPDVEKIELYQSCPITIAFAVGMALGTHAMIEVFQWDGSEERCYLVFRLNTLRHGR